MGSLMNLILLKCCESFQLIYRVPNEGYIAHMRQSMGIKRSRYLRLNWTIYHAITVSRINANAGANGRHHWTLSIIWTLTNSTLLSFIYHFVLDWNSFLFIQIDCTLQTSRGFLETQSKNVNDSLHFFLFLFAKLCLIKKELSEQFWNWIPKTVNTVLQTPDYVLKFQWIQSKVLLSVLIPTFRPNHVIIMNAANGGVLAKFNHNFRKCQQTESHSSWMFS